MVPLEKSVRVISGEWFESPINRMEYVLMLKLLEAEVTASWMN